VSLAYKQWAAVRIHLLSMTLPPHCRVYGPLSISMRHCHGHECSTASSPPTMRLDGTEGWTVGWPHSRPPAPPAAVHTENTAVGGVA